MRTFYRRLVALAWETMIGGWALWAGIAGLLRIGLQEDILAKVLGGDLVFAFQIVYLTSGALLLTGLGLGRRNLESAGVVLLLTSVIVRGVALFYVVGLSVFVVNAYVFDALIVWACMTRLRQLTHGDVIVFAKATK